MAVMPVHEEYAPAKVNLSLQVLGKKPDGYHALASLVVFADTGDRLSARPSGDLCLALTGPCTRGLSGGADNLVWKAAQALRSVVFSPAAHQTLAANPLQGAALELEKNLPLASGLGGGSADAAACLRVLPRLWGAEVGQATLARLALSLGADVPVCLESRATWVEGVGERLRPVPVASLQAVLVNPGVEVPTAAIFARLDAARREVSFSGKASCGGGPSAPTGLDTVDALLPWLAAHPNDLEKPARAAFPVIGTALEALGHAPGCRLARLSGSGATCFGIFLSAGAAQAAARDLQRQMPRAWVRPVCLNTPGGYKTPPGP